jgi:crotonobetainyl-CoA:carnitine CoA-transferase CaiB-like acyl-CoA transferase
MGALVGAPRAPAQTVREYSRVLEAAGVPAQPLRAAADAIETEAFSGRPLTADERSRIEAALAEA